MKVIFTCGGTAGHVNPALALAGYMKKKHADLEVLFVGTPDGIEKGLAEKAGYAYAGIEISSFQRSLKKLRHNLHTARTMLSSRREANAVLRRFQPDLVIGTGGYASYPILKAAAKQGIPTAVHESNMIPGLTTKLLEPSAKVIMVGFEDCRAHYQHPEKIRVTGTPVRGDFFDLTREQARAKLGYTDEKPLVVSFWGSLGASTMNANMIDFFAREKQAAFPFHHVHAVGSRGWAEMQQKLQQHGLDNPHLDIREYIYDMAVVMRAADLVICRAGASTISELTALGMPAVMVPSPYVVANHQEKNARILEKHGGAVVLLEQDAGGEKLYETAASILADPTRLQAMQNGMAELGILDATERIYDTVMSLLG